MSPLLRRWIILAGLATSGDASAHYPHDMAYFAAVSPDPAQPRLATTLERIDLDIVGISDNGLDWGARLVQASNDGRVSNGVFLTADRLVLAAGTGGLRVSDDAGDTITRVAYVTDSEITQVATSSNVMQDGIAFAVGTSALWRTDDWGDTWEAVSTALDTGFIDVDVSPDFATDGRVCAVEAEALSCSDDGGLTWRRTRVPEGAYRVSVGAGTRVWVSARDNGLLKSADEGETWTVTGYVGEDAGAISELAGGLVLLATGLSAEWRSTDGGESWTFVPVLTLPFDQSFDGVQFFDFVEGPGGEIYMASWNGLARSDDRGLTYAFYNTERIQNTHSVILTEGAPGGLWAWYGTYGGGPVRTDIHTHRAFTAPSLVGRFTRNTPTTTSWERDGTAVFDEGYSTYRTTDAGVTWDKIAGDPMVDGTVRVGNDVKGVALAPNTTVDPFLLTTVGQARMDFVSSPDLGDHWTIGVQDPVCLTDGFAVALSPRWPDESRAWAACGGAIYESDDRGETWTVLGDTHTSFVFRIVERTDGVLLVATSDGLWRMDASSTTQVAFDDELVVGAATSVEEGDNTAFAVLPAGGWKRSDDGGETWVDLVAPSADVTRMISMSPTFAEDGTVAVAGCGGAWASTDRGDTWFSIHAVELYESFHDAWAHTGTWSSARVVGASGGDVVTTSEVGATRTLLFRGIDVTLEAPKDSPAGVVAVSIDGGTPEEVRFPTTTTRFWQSHDLADTWHTLVIEDVIGTVTLDRALVTRLAHVPLENDTGDTAADSGADGTIHGARRVCGCGGTEHASLLRLLPFGLVRRRRSPAKAVGTRGRGSSRRP